MMTDQKGRPAPLEWPTDLAEIARQLAREEMRSWLEPKSGDLLRDVLYLQNRAAKEKNKTVRGIYARAAIVMGTATIEAVTNDALATIYELVTDVMPSECAGEPPWCYFRGRSARPIARLLQRGSFAEKRTYVLGQVERVSGHVLEEQILKDIDRLVTFRNRVVHMSFQAQPGKYKPILNTAQMAHVAALAGDTVRYYLDFLSETFSGLKLPIPTIRPWRHFDDEWQKD
jgi:hypothetical protein